MKSIIELIELSEGAILFFAVGWVYARVTGYGEYYGNMLSEDDEDTDLTIKNNNKDNDDRI
jgi:hypothetical protein